jgi:GT2 family glycosyltransferase
MYIKTHRARYEKIIFDVIYESVDSNETLSAIQKAKELENERQQHADELADELGKLKSEHEKELEDERCRNVNTIEQLKNEYENKLEERRQQYADVTSKLEDERRQHAEIEYHYHAILNSTCWKITKPIRLFMDFTKLMLKSFIVTKYIYKFLVHTKRFGLKMALKNTLLMFKRLPLIKYVYKFMAYWKKFGLRNSIAKVKDYLLRRRKKEIRFSILVPLYNTPHTFLEEMIESVRKQTYKNWELCLADGSDEQYKYVEKVCRSFSEKDKRILYKKLENNFGVSENTNRCIDMSTGDYMGLLDHDDLLHPSALFEVMKAICEKNAEVIYTDEDKTDADGKRFFDPHCKPDFAIDNLRAYNYICHFLVFQRKLLNRAGAFDSRYDGGQDYDITFRLIEQAKCIVHIPKILYHWRAMHGSTADNINTKPYVIKASIEVVKSHLERCGLNADVVDIHSTVHRIIYRLSETPMVSILIPNKDHIDDLRKCISSILHKTSYVNYEIVIIENNSNLEETFLYYEEIKKKSNIKIVAYNGKFNYSKINNFAVKQTDSEYVILLNNDIEIISSCWIEEMLMFCQRKDVGAVGAKLYYNNDTLQHGGVILGLGGVAGHSHKYFPRNHPGYSMRLSIQQDLSAVTAACMMIKRTIFEETGGFNNDFAIAFNDVDICMRIRRAGYLIVWTPFAEAYHYESKSRGLEDTPEKQERFKKECALFQRLWGKELAAGDPYYNVNLTLDREDFSLA